jgi:hypothetical protein
MHPSAEATPCFAAPPFGDCVGQDGRHRPAFPRLKGLGGGLTFTRFPTPRTGRLDPCGMSGSGALGRRLGPCVRIRRPRTTARLPVRGGLGRIAGSPWAAPLRGTSRTTGRSSGPNESGNSLIDPASRFISRAPGLLHRPVHLDRTPSPAFRHPRSAALPPAYACGRPRSRQPTRSSRRRPCAPRTGPLLPREWAPPGGPAPRRPSAGVVGSRANAARPRTG